MKSADNRGVVQSRLQMLHIHVFLAAPLGTRHKAAKKAFDAFGLEKLPTVRSLNEEFARLLAEKKAAYAEYHRAQEQMRELLIHKANAAYLLGLDEQNRQTTERQREEK